MLDTMRANSIACSMEVPAILVWTMPAGPDNSILEPGGAGTSIKGWMRANEPEAILGVGRRLLLAAVNDEKVLAGLSMLGFSVQLQRAACIVWDTRSPQLVFPCFCCILQPPQNFSHRVQGC